MSVSKADFTNPHTVACSANRAHKYLRHVRNSCPTLYNDLKQMKPDDLQMLLNIDRLRTTYQVYYNRKLDFRPTADWPVDVTAMMRRFRQEMRN